MSIYAGRRAGTWRVVIWHRNRANEFIVEGKRRDATAFEAAKRLEYRFEGELIDYVRQLRRHAFQVEARIESLGFAA